MTYGAVGVGLAAVVVAAVTVGGGKDSKGTGNAGPASSSSASPSTTTGAAGLPRGQASAAGVLGSKRIAGVPRGFPDTEPGAIESATVVAAQSFGVQRMTKTDRAAFLAASYVTVPDGADQSAATYQAQNFLNDQGQLTEPATGTVDTSRRFTSLCHPELGAYKVENYSATTAAVDVWLPCISGVIGGDTSDLSVNWMLGRFDLAWTDGDWKITKTGAGSFSSVVEPSDSSNPVTSYSERARLLSTLGTGWEVYKDASDQTPAEVTEAKQ